MKIILNEKSNTGLYELARKIYEEVYEMENFDLDKFVNSICELSEREVFALSKKYNFDIDSSMQYEFESEERCRQTAVRAVRKLRLPSRARVVLNLTNYKLKSEITLDSPIEDLRMSNRSTCLLLKNGIKTLGDLFNSNLKKILSIKHIGPKSYNEITFTLFKYTDLIK